MEDPPGAKHLPTLDYVKHVNGALLPLPVRETELEDIQTEQYLKKKQQDKDDEESKFEMVAQDTAAKAYDIDANPYEGLPWRNGK